MWFVSELDEGTFPTVSPNSGLIRSLEANPSYGLLTPAPVTECQHSSHIFRPCALGFLALAIAVALWGFGYKLSRYDPHPSAASRASIAKLWDKQPASFPTNASSHGCRAHLPSGTQPPWLSVPSPHRKETSAALDIDRQEERASGPIRSLIPSRSPPVSALQG